MGLYRTTTLSNNGGNTLAGLDDVQIVNPQDNQDLVYDNTLEKWTNKTNILDYDDTIDILGEPYDPVQPSGGTTVVANPSGTATDDLNKLQVGSTIYNIPSGGSGGGGFEIVTKRVLVNSSSSFVTGGIRHTRVTLNDVVSDGRAYIIGCTLDGGTIGNSDSYNGVITCSPIYSPSSPAGNYECALSYYQGEISTGNAFYAIIYIVKPTS